MKFKIYRTSDDYYCKNQPCEGAVLEGKDHWNCNVWSIEINSLADLIDLERELCDKLIFDGDSIEIYDEYRE